jgi:hypothetical protein
MSEKPISPLRQRMLEDMNMRRFVPDRVAQRSSAELGVFEYRTVRRNRRFNSGRRRNMYPHAGARLRSTSSARTAS